MMKESAQTSVLAGETIGLELEMGVADRENGQSRCVEEAYFERLADIKRRRGERVQPNVLEDPETRVARTISLSTPLGESCLDNGFNLLETSFSPVRQDEGGLDVLGAARAFHCQARMQSAIFLNHPNSIHPGEDTDASFH
jgi:hypothetical protein